MLKQQDRQEKNKKNGVDLLTMTKIDRLYIHMLLFMNINMCPHLFFIKQIVNYSKMVYYR